MHGSMIDIQLGQTSFIYSDVEKGEKIMSRKRWTGVIVV